MILSPDPSRSVTARHGQALRGRWRTIGDARWRERCGRWLRAVGVAGGAVAALLPASAVAAEVSVAVAANFAAPMARLARDFQAATGHVIKASAGPTLRLATQVAQGAPYQVLLAADDETPQRLIDQGHAVAGTRMTYAVGQLVLWSADPRRVDGQGAVLAQGRFEHLAIANPRLAPYGQAAMQVLRHLGLAEQLAAKLVTGDSVAQARQFIETGNAELGFVALSQVLVPGQPMAGSVWRVPAALHAEIRQDAVLLKAGADQPAARAWLDYLKSPAARAIILEHGYR